MSEEEKKKQKQEEEVKLVRILSKDIRGDKTLYAGLRMIGGVSWGFANALCKKLGLLKNKRIQDLSKEEIGKIEKFISEPEVPIFIMNRRKDRDSGEDIHLSGADLKLQKEFDLKRLKKIKSYKGIRHGNNLPVRGQRTKSNFRRNRKKSGATGGKK
jgi:small subunit ribosomal protein S13